MNTHHDSSTTQRPITAYFLGRPSSVYRDRFGDPARRRRLPGS